MTIEEIKAELHKLRQECIARKDDDFEYKTFRGRIEAYQEALILLNDWNGK